MQTRFICSQEHIGREFFTNEYVQMILGDLDKMAGLLMATDKPSLGREDDKDKAWNDLGNTLREMGEENENS